MTLLVLLPGAHMTAADFATHGFLFAVGRQAPAVEVQTLETGTEGYLDGAIVQRLHGAIILPARAQRRRLWLGGISLGGLGALLCAQAFPDAVEGLLLLSPFMGSRGLIAEVEAAGGLRAWNPGLHAATTPERRALAWLGEFRSGNRLPVLRLAYGEDDRYAASSRLLADILPRAHVVTSTGGHDWGTWEALWPRLLQTAPFSNAETSR